MKTSIFKLAACLFLISAPAFGQSIQPDLPFDFEFEPDHSVPIVNLSVVFRDGSANDPKNLSGLSNFTGEMMLRGTRERSKQQLELKLDELGSTVEVETRMRAVIVRASLLSAQIKPFLDVLTEILLEPRFQEREIEKFKAQLVSELMAMQSSDDYLARHHQDTLLFGDHPYGRPGTGLPSTVRKFTRAELVKRHGELFSRAGLILAGTGDVDPELIKTWGLRLYYKLPEVRKKSEAPPVEWPQMKKLQIVDKPDRTQSPVIVSQPGVSFSDPNFFYFYLADYIFGGDSFSSRLMKEIRIKRGWSYGANSSLRPIYETGEWSFEFAPATKDVANALALSLQMAEAYKQNGALPEELTKAKESLINGSSFMYNTPAKRVENALVESLLHLPHSFYRSFASHINAVTLEELNRKIKTLIQPDRFVITVVGSAKDLTPALAAAAGVPEPKVLIKSYKSE